MQPTFPGVGGPWLRNRLGPESPTRPPGPGPAQLFLVRPGRSRKVSTLTTLSSYVLECQQSKTDSNHTPTTADVVNAALTTAGVALSRPGLLREMDFARMVVEYDRRIENTNDHDAIHSLCEVMCVLLELPDKYTIGAIDEDRRQHSQCREIRALVQGWLKAPDRLERIRLFFSFLDDSMTLYSEAQELKSQFAVGVEPDRHGIDVVSKFLDFSESDGWQMPFQVPQAVSIMITSARPQQNIASWKSGQA